jgi:hypothetical protein
LEEGAGGFILGGRQTPTRTIASKMIMVGSVGSAQDQEEGATLMTGRLKIISVTDIDYYLERTGGRMDYYLTPASDGHEPPGVWVGTGAGALGMHGLVKPEVMKALYEQGITPSGEKIGRKPANYVGNAGRTAELQERIQAAIGAEREAKGLFLTREREEEIERRERAKVKNSVLAWDFTWGVTKSISLTHAGLLAQVSRATAAGKTEAAAEYQRQANLIVDAIRETAREIIDRFEATAAFTRTGGHHGSGGDGAYRDAKHVIGAAFLQSTNRDNDPHLHVHTVVLNLVQRADGADEKWRTLDGEPLLRARGRLDAIAKRLLARKLMHLGIPLVQRGDGDGFEVGGVEQAQIDAFSSRKTAVEQGVWVEDHKRGMRGCGCACTQGSFCGGCGHERCPWHLEPGMKDLVEAYTARYGRPPSRARVWALHEQAFRSGRKPKDEELTSTAELLERWDQRAAEHRVRALGSIPAAVRLYAEQHPASLGTGRPGALGAGGSASSQTISEAALRADGSVLGRDERHRAIRIAVARVQQQNATWYASDLMWEIQAALPPLHQDTDSTALMELCLREAIGNEVEGAEVAWLGKPPDVTDVSVLGVRASDGQSVFRKPQTDKYCTLDHLDTEKYLLHAAGRHARPKMTEDEASDLLAGSGLSDEQMSAAVMLLSTTRPTVVFVGPAGTGKSFTLGAMARAYIERTGRRVIGLALAKNAVRVLQGEGIEEAYTIADFLGQLRGGGSRGHIRIGAGDILIIDESSQVPTEALARLQSIASQAGAWMIQAGDTEQLPSPEAGGMMRVIASEHGYVQIREVRRFREEWERAASLKLRSGDTSVIAEYKQHGRIYEGRRDDMYDRAVRSWLGDHLAGKDTLLLAGSNAEAAELAGLARRQLIRLGRVRNSGDITLMDDNDASVGDLLRARQNSKIAAGGKPLENRDVIRLVRWWIQGVRRQAVMTRQLPGGRWSPEFLVPEDYLRSHAELAYAGNVDVAEGKTVDTGHELATASMNRARHLVGLTRGRERNTSYVVTAEAQGRHIGGDRPAPELMREAHNQPVTAESVLETIMTREPGEMTATEVLHEARAFPRSMPHLHKLWQVVTRESAFPGYDRALQERLQPDEYSAFLQEDQRAVLHHQLRCAELAGQDIRALLDRVLASPLTGARSIAAVIHGRIEKLHLPRFGDTSTYVERTPDIANPDYARIARATAEAMDAKQLELGEEVARRPPVWAVRYLGPPPREEGALRQDWIGRAGIAAGYRELANHKDAAEAIGELPPTGSAELREAWAAAARALEMPEEESDVRIASAGQLEALVRAYERVQAWAPEYVSDRLEETSLAAENTRATARIAQAEAENSGRTRDQQRAARAQTQAEALEARRALLTEIAEARAKWAEHTEPARVKANDAAMELARREEAKARAKAKARPDAGGSGGPEAQPQPQPQSQPEPARSDEELADLARLARERIRMEKEAEERDPWEREPWEEQAEQEASATWQPGRLGGREPDPQPEAESWD